LKVSYESDVTIRDSIKAGVTRADFMLRPAFFYV